MRTHLERYMKVGVGGFKCVCCFPAPRSKERRAIFRSAKRKEKFEAMKIEKDNQED